jgi:methionyl aminopeptidase
VILNEFYGDSAYSYAVGNVSQEVAKLLKITKESLFLGVENAVVGKRVGDIGNAIQSYCETHGYSVVREMVGHGLGRNLHEEPEIPNYGRRGTGMKLNKGLVICIEPMINLGKRQIVQEADGWTIRTSDRMPSAHFELAVAVDNGKADVLSTFKYIEEVLKQ